MAVPHMHGKVAAAFVAGYLLGFSATVALALVAIWKARQDGV